ncbi:MAG: polyphosphate kinase 1, partial [Mogibacterium sp.]|nr:polyphosphate kinase 1 [Mogibacterium sp.]
EGFTQNREISWLRYNERVLEEALDDSVPLFERLRFIAIFVSNLEEFFKVRVGSLLGEDDEGDDLIDEKSGMTAADQLRRILDLVPGLLMKKDMAYGLVERKLAEAGAARLEPWQLGEEDRGRCFDFFRDEIKDSLIVRVLDAGEPMPAIDEDRPYIMAALDAELEDKFGFIDIPGMLPLIKVLPGPGFRYVLTEDIIKMFADTLFVPFVPLELHVIDIARNDEASGGTDAANTAVEMRDALRRRKAGPADKLISDGLPGKALRSYFEKSLDMDGRQMFTTTRIDFSYVDELEKLLPDEIKERIMYKPHVPVDQTKGIRGNIIDEVKKRDLLSSYPQDSMDLFLGLLREASFSRDVTEIRITIYRLASNPKIADYLIYAARTGKKVRVVMELRARFDEEKNLAWADRLSAAGCKVYFGTDKYKVHSKMCQIVSESTSEDGKPAKHYITQISTGNYNEKTARQYTDLSLMTYDQEIGKAVSRLFRDICKDRVAVKEHSYAPLAVSPVNMRSEIIKLIRRETKKGKSGRIFFKINSLTDEDVIEALMEASCAGCQVRMIVRGICCLLPGVEDCTENVCIVNKVGRFLEHSRVYIFGSGIDEIMYISSADLMKRNLDRRIEVACPVKSGRIRDRIRAIIYDVYCDMDKGRVMLPDGTYAIKPKS